LLSASKDKKNRLKKERELELFCTVLLPPCSPVSSSVRPPWTEPSLLLLLLLDLPRLVVTNRELAPHVYKHPTSARARAPRSDNKA
jgi:hypothetical protein